MDTVSRNEKGGEGSASRDPGFICCPVYPTSCCHIAQICKWAHGLECGGGEGWFIQDKKPVNSVGGFLEDLRAGGKGE